MYFFKSIINSSAPSTSPRQIGVITKTEALGYTSFNLEKNFEIRSYLSFDHNWFVPKDIKILSILYYA